jgi:hypothetical protein
MPNDPDPDLRLAAYYRPAGYSKQMGDAQREKCVRLAGVLAAQLTGQHQDKFDITQQHFCVLVCGKRKDLNALPETVQVCGKPGDVKDSHDFHRDEEFVNPPKKRR